MNNLSAWEMALLGVLVVLVLLWVGPGVKTLLEQSRQAEHRDWSGLLLPIILVILFVIFLIYLV